MPCVEPLHRPANFRRRYTPLFTPIGTFSVCCCVLIPWCLASGVSRGDAEQRRWLLNEHYHHALRTPPSSTTSSTSASASAAMGNGVGLGQVRLFNP